MYALRLNSYFKILLPKDCNCKCNAPLVMAGFLWGLFSWGFFKVNIFHKRKDIHIWLNFNLVSYINYMPLQKFSPVVSIP